MIALVNKYKGSFILLITAFIWGIAFVFQKDSMDYVGPFTFLAFRGFITAIILIPLSFIIENHKKVDKGKINYKVEIIAGILSGLFLFLGSSFQQVGLVTVSVTKGGFLTSTYIVLVPIIGLLFKKKTTIKNWICMIISLIGFYILSCGDMLFQGELIKPESGDIVVLLGALFFAFQIIIIDNYVEKVNAMRLNGYSFLVVGIISFIIAMLKETITFEGIKGAIISILYVSIFSSCIAYTLQIVGQKYTKPDVATLIMSLESVFALIGGVIFLSENLKYNEIIGCVIIFICVILSQISIKKNINNIDNVLDKHNCYK